MSPAEGVVTSTFTAVLVVLLFCASKAFAVKVAVPRSADVKSTGVWNGAAVSVAIRVAPRQNSTLVTPMLSLTVACSVVEPGTSTVAGLASSETVGGVVSGLTTTLTTALVVLLFAASKAFAVKATVPMSAGVKLTAWLNGAVVSVPIRVAPRKNSTLATPALSLAVAASVVEPGATTGFGLAERLTLGGVASAPSVTVTCAVLVVRIGCVAVRVNVVVPVTLTVAEPGVAVIALSGTVNVPPPLSIEIWVAPFTDQERVTGPPGNCTLEGETVKLSMPTRATRNCSDRIGFDRLLLPALSNTRAMKRRVTCPVLPGARSAFSNGMSKWPLS